MSDERNGSRDEEEDSRSGGHSKRRMAVHAGAVMTAGIRIDRTHEVNSCCAEMASE
jgi:hypothetical protein